MISKECDFLYNVNLPKKPKLEVEIDGKLLDYDFCADKIDAYDEYNNLKADLKYLGESKIYYVNRIKNEEKNVYHYWKIMKR